MGWSYVLKNYPRGIPVEYHIQEEVDIEEQDDAEVKQDVTNVPNKEV